MISEKGEKHIPPTPHFFEWVICFAVRYVLKPTDDLDTEYSTYEFNRWCETLKRNAQNADQKL